VELADHGVELAIGVSDGTALGIELGMRLDEHLAGLKDRLGGAELGSTLPAGTIGSHNGLRPVKTSPGFRGFKKGSAAHYDASYSKQEWSRRRLQWVLPSSSGRCSCPSCRSWKKDPHHRRRCGCRCHKQRDPRSGQGDRHNRTLFLRYYYSIRSFQPHPSSDHHPPDHQQQAPPHFVIANIKALAMMELPSWFLPSSRLQKRITFLARQPFHRHRICMNIHRWRLRP
jgi:hypothetical protein